MGFGAGFVTSSGVSDSRDLKRKSNRRDEISYPDNNLSLRSEVMGLVLNSNFFTHMDTISRENNSMLPVGAIIVGVIGLLLGGYSAIKLSSVNRTLASQEEKMARFDTLESKVGTSASASDKVTRDVSALTRSTQEAFNQVGAELGNLRGAITKLQEAPQAKVAAGKKDPNAAPAVAGPDEYIVKAGDTGTKIATSKGVSWSDLQAVNSGVNWNRLAIGQTLKLPKK